MRRLKKILGMGLVIMTCYGCLSVGRSFRSNDLSWIVEKKTTKKEVYTVLGDPFRTGVDSGRLTWSYGYYKYNLFGDTRTKDLVIYFNRDGTVHSYTFNTSFPEEKKKWRNKTTP
jgi:outer membrane protein assembly factor BamE (lipoprotein component of BamABCDE complex)